MNGKQQEVGTMKIRLKGLEKAVEFTFPNLRTKIKFDEKGVAEVPVWIGKKLLGPDFAGCGYEAVGLASPKEINRIRSAYMADAVTKEVSSKEKEFLEEIKD